MVPAIVVVALGVEATKALVSGAAVSSTVLPGEGRIEEFMLPGPASRIVAKIHRLQIK